MWNLLPHLVFLVSFVSPFCSCLETQDVKELSATNQSLLLATSFFAGANRYGSSAADLRRTCRDVGIESDIMELPIIAESDPLMVNVSSVMHILVDMLPPNAPEFPMTWPLRFIHSFKSLFILCQLIKTRRPLLWVDSDIRILRKPDFLQFSGIDFCAVNNKMIWRVGWDGWSAVMSSGLLFFNATLPAIRLLEDWVWATRYTSNRNAADDKVLDRVFDSRWSQRTLDGRCFNCLTPIVRVPDDIWVQLSKDPRNEYPVAINVMWLQRHKYLIMGTRTSQLTVAHHPGKLTNKRHQSAPKKVPQAFFKSFLPNPVVQSFLPHTLTSSCQVHLHN